MNTAHKNIEVILLAAGASTRMQGKDKLLEAINGQTLLRRVAAAACASAAHKTHVILPEGSSKRQQTLAGLPVSLAYCETPSTGMATSIRTGIAALSSSCRGCIIALADMPDVSMTHINKLIEAYMPNTQTSIYRCFAQDGTAGHPILFTRKHFSALSRLQGDQGARVILQQMAGKIQSVPTSGQGAVTDLDTPQAWQIWRANHTFKT